MNKLLWAGNLHGRASYHSFTCSLVLLPSRKPCSAWKGHPASELLPTLSDKQWPTSGDQLQGEMLLAFEKAG